MADQRQRVFVEYRAIDELSKVNKAIGRSGQDAAKAIERGMGRSSRSVQTFGKRANKTLNSLNKTVNNLAGAFGRRLVVSILAVGAVLKGLTSLRSATTDASNFRNALGEMATIAEGGAAQVAGMKDEILDLAIAFGVNEVEVAGAGYETFSRVTKDSAEALEFMEAALTLSTAGLGNAREVTILLAGAMEQFGDQVESVGDLADLFFKTVDQGGLTLSELASSLSGVAPVAASLGVGLDEVAAALATLTAGGTPLAQAVTQLRGLFNALGVQSSNVAAIFKDQLGVEFTEQTLATEGLAFVLKGLSEATNGSFNQLQKLLVQSEAVQGVLGLTKNAAQRLEETLVNIGDRGGVAAVAALLRLQDPAKRVELAFNAIRITFSQAFGDTVLLRLNTFFNEGKRLETVLFAVETAGKVMAETLGVAFAVVESGISIFQDFIDELGGAEKASELTGLAITAFASEVRATVRETFHEIQNLTNAIVAVPLTVQLAVERANAALSGLPGVTETATGKLTRLIQKQQRLTQDFDQGIDFLSRDIAEGLVENITNTSAEIQTLRDAGVKTIGELAKETTIAVAKSFEPIPDEIKALRLTAEEDLAKLSLAVAKFRLEALNGAGAPPVEVPSRNLPVGGPLFGPFTAAPDRASQEADAQAAQLKAYQDLNAVFQKDLIPSLDEMLAAQEAMTRARLKDIETALVSGKISDEQALGLRETVARLNEQEASLIRNTKAFEDNTVELTKTQRIADQFADSLGRSLSSSLAQIALDADRTRESFQRLTQGIIANLLQIILQETLAASITSGIRSLFGLGGIDSAVKGFADGGTLPGGRTEFMPLKGYADGGPIISKPHMAVVGEGPSPEAVVPLKNGKIGVDLNGQVGGTNVSIAITAMDGKDVKRVLIEEEKTIRGIIQRAVAGSDQQLIQLVKRTR